MVRVIFFLLTFSLLSGCVSPMSLGISEAEWRNYSPEEQQKIKSGYYEILKTRFSPREKGVADGTYLHVAVSGGKVYMPPFASMYDYVPIEFEIASGDCKTLQIKGQNGDQKVPMKVCYQNQTLYLDPSSYDMTKRIGSIQLHYSPIWDRGFIYHKVSSSGYVHLTRVDVSVQRFSDNSAK
jgi:hypothetical protein